MRKKSKTDQKNKTDQKSKNLLIIVLVILAGVFLFAYANEMSVLNFSKYSGWSQVSAGINEPITVSYNISVMQGANKCTLIMDVDNKTYTKTHSVSYPGQVDGAFDPIYLKNSTSGEVEIIHTNTTTGQSFYYWYNLSFLIKGGGLVEENNTSNNSGGNTGNKPDNNTAGNGTTNGSTSGGGKASVISNNSTKTGGAIVVSTNQSGSGVDVEITENSSNSLIDESGTGTGENGTFVKDKDGNEIDPGIPSSFKEALQNLWNLFKKILSGDIKLGDLWDAIIELIKEIADGGFDWTKLLKVLLYALALFLVIVVALFVFYVFLKVVGWIVAAFGVTKESKKEARKEDKGFWYADSVIENNRRVWVEKENQRKKR